jgi:Acyl-CoA carboxylase epsilon subunit
VSTPRIAALSVLRGSPTPEELAALLVVLAAVRRAPDQPGPPPTAARGWGRPAAWNHPGPATGPGATGPGAVGWRRTSASRKGRNT